MIGNTKAFCLIGKGIVLPDKVRVYHRLWGKLAPAKIRLNWNDDDSVPFIYYLDQKGRIQFGSSDERYPDLLNKIERSRFDYPHIWLSGRLWSKRKIIVFDQFSESNKDEKYVLFHEFLEISGHYIEGIKEYKLVFPKKGNKGVVYMNSVFEVYERCLNESMHNYMMMHSPVGGWKSMITGLSAIDKIIGELKKSELVVVAGRPSMGKTSLLVSITNNLLTRVPIAFFSLEMSGVKLVDRVMSNACRFRVGTITNGQLSNHEWDELDNTIKEILTSQLYIDDSPELSLDELESKINKFVEDHGVKIVMIDSIQLINSGSNSQMENLAKCLERLKELAKRLNIAIMVVSCLYQGNKVFYSFPKFSHHREYQTIRQFSDWSFYIYRTDKYLSRIFSQTDNAVSIGHVEIVNHNTNKSGLAVLEYDKRCMRFSNHSRDNNQS
jgi:KaiC/GvpD/RAD55 family RecA-like ATPase